jgi:hypothetical protein
MEAPMTEWTRFADSLARNFSANRDVDSDMAPPRHNSHVNNYIDNFITYARRINLDSEQHQVSLFVHGLRQELREVVIRHLPRSMETAINPARNLDGTIAIHATATPASAPD